jgi:hypothetical protein
VSIQAQTIQARESRPVDLSDHLHRSESAVIKIQFWPGTRTMISTERSAFLAPSHLYNRRIIGTARPISRR